MFSLLIASIAYFLPPSDWELAQPKTPSAYLQVGFFGKSATGFRPSINYAIEEVDVSLKEYIKSVKELYKSDLTSKWRDLGKFSMECGEGRLMEMASNSAYGEIKIYQAVIVKNRKAHILTAAVLKEQFPKYQQQLLQSLRSLHFSENHWEPIANSETQVKIKALLEKEKTEEEWKQLQGHAEALAHQLGAHWQYLVLQEGSKKIYHAPLN